MTSRTRLGSAMAIASVALAAAGCAGVTSAPTPDATPSPSVASTRSALATATESADKPSLIVLGGDLGSEQGLWRFQAPDLWVALEPAIDSTAIGTDRSGLILANRDSVETRSAAAPAVTGKTIQLKWPASSPTTPVAGIDRSPSGSLALALSDGTGSSYAIASPDGTVAIPRSAPEQSFSPLVAWLDDSRLLVLSTDEAQVSRLAVLDVAKDALTTSKAVGGVHSFALSGDRKRLVVASGAALFVAPVTDWLGSAAPKWMADLAPDQVVWDLALNDAGDTVAMLSGTEAADGKVSAVVEVEYSLRGGTWTQILSSPVPFKTAKGQVWAADLPAS